MSGKRPGAGVRVSGGKLRVDAARAIDKLRSYQLADPLAWVLEVVRAGTTFPESEHIRVEGEGGDLFVAITCSPFAADRLPRLFEELVDPSPAADARGLRLLAMGVNAALGRTEGGSAPRHVDVYVIDADGAARVRFTPQLFQVEEETGVALGMRALKPEIVAPPSHAPRPRRGVLVHARAVMGLGLLARWAIGEEPRELALVRDAARELRVPITVQGLPVPADPSIVLREPLESGGYVALVAPRVGRVGATLEAAEAGVVLSREPWNCGVGIAGATVPLLLRVDRERLPTNAARSAVRWDEPMVAGALEEAGDALRRMIAKLAEEIDRVTEPGRLSWLRAIGLTLLASDVAGVGFRARLSAGAVSGAITPLLDAKLLNDAIGRRRTPRELSGSSETRVHLASTFLEPGLAPWLGDVLAAIAGDPTHLLFGNLPPESAEPLVEQARRARDHEARWLAIAIETPTVKKPDGALARVVLPKKLTLRGRDPVALEGEVVLGVAGDELVTELHLAGRRLETRRVRVGVGIAVVASCAELRPTMTFDAAVDDDVLRAVLEATDDAVQRGCDAIARVLAADAKRDASITTDDERIARDPRAHALVRHAILARVARDTEGARRAILDGPLGRAAVWPRIGGAEISLLALARADAIGVVQRGQPWPERVPAERPVLVLSDAERTALRLAFPRASFVDYGRVRGSSRPLADMTLTLSARGRVGLTSEGPTFRAFAAWGDTPETGIEAFHMGQRLGFHATRGSRVSVVVVVDDERIVPDEMWTAGGVSWGALEDWHEAKMASSRIARAVVAAWLGREPPNLVHEIDLDAISVVRAVLVEASVGFEERLTEGERTALAKLPLFPTLHGRRASAESLRADGRIAFVPEQTFAPALVRDLPIDALLGSRDEARGLAVLVGGTPVDASDRVREAVVRRKRERRLEVLARGSVEPLELPGAEPVVRIVGDGIEGVIGYRPHGGASRVSVLVDRRWLLDLEDDAFPPNVDAKVTIVPDLLDDEATALAPAAVTRVRGALLASARTLAVTIVTERPNALFRDDSVRTLVSQMAGGRRRGEVGAMLRALMEQSTLSSSDGGPMSIAQGIQGDELLAVRDPITPVAPAEGEPATALDRPFAVVPWDPGDARLVLLEKIAGARVRDVSRELRALYATRRAQRGLIASPTLSSGHEPSLSRTIETLAKLTPEPSFVLATLGFGVIGLSAKRARVRFFLGGEEVDQRDLDLVPAFEAAIESPMLGEGDRLEDAAASDVERALTMVLAQLLRTLADANAFDGAPDWALDAQCDAALLGGTVHLERLGPLRLFKTTGGARVSYADLQAQRSRLGPIWWTPDLRSTLLPLDPERFALRLTAAHAKELARAIALTEATQELQLDAIARTNRSKPPVTSIALTDAERAAAIGTTSMQETDDDELVVAALWPAFAPMHTLALYLGFSPLGEIEPAGDIPIVARARSSSLTPNRTWSGATRDAVLLAIERSAAELADDIVARMIRLPNGPLPSVTIDRAFMGAIPHPSKRVVRGALGLGPIDLDEDDDEGVRVIDRRMRDPDAAPERARRATAGKRAPAVVPLVGIVVLWGEDATTVASTLDAVLRHAYTRLLAHVAGRVAADKSPDADLDRAHLVRGAELGFVHGKDLRDTPMPFGRGALGTLEGIVEVLGKNDAVVALQPDEDAEHASLARYAMFTLDGSLAAQRLAIALGPRALSRSDALALVLGLRKAEKTLSIPPPPPTPVRKKASEPPPTPDKKKEKKPKAVRVSSGPVEPLASRTLAMLRQIGRESEVVVAAGRSEPLVETTENGISLAGRSEVLALAAGTPVHRERSAVLLAAHVVTVHDRSLALSALARLLD